MSRLPRVTGHQAVQASQSVAFELIRDRGSHHFLRHDDGRATVIPIHAGEMLGPGLLSSILKDATIDRETFQELL